MTSLEELHDIAYALEEIEEVVGVFAVVSPRPPAPTVYVQIAREGRSLTITRAHYALRRQTGRSETAGVAFVEELPPRKEVRPVVLNDTARFAARGRASARGGRVEMGNALFPVRTEHHRELLVVGPRELVAMAAEVYQSPHSVTGVQTVDDALAVLRTFPPDEVVVTEALGVGEGKLLLVLRESYAFRNLPVLVVVPEASLPTAMKVLATADRPWQVVSQASARRAIEDRFRWALHERKREPVRVLLVDRDPETKALSVPAGADIVFLRVEHTDDALWLLREATFALVLCDATLTEGTTFAYRTLWEHEPATKSKTILIAPRAAVDALPPSRDPSRPASRRVVSRPLTRASLMALLAEIANGLYGE